MTEYDELKKAAAPILSKMRNKIPLSDADRPILGKYLQAARMNGRAAQKNVIRRFVIDKYVPKGQELEEGYVRNLTRKLKSFAHRTIKEDAAISAKNKAPRIGFGVSFVTKRADKSVQRQAAKRQLVLAQIDANVKRVAAINSQTKRLQEKIKL